MMEKKCLNGDLAMMISKPMIYLMVVQHEAIPMQE